ncbi:Rieske 2Fe-2S domain-containing protein [Methylocella sp.]|uniref:Rieske 2Fe-2S domain-containing protein n=1 Tax=Methylocella sp. TaxID=1978226 RepID=UPI003784AB9D
MAWKRVCGVSDVPPDTVAKFVVGGVPLAVVNYGGAFRVLPPVCPHMEEPLDKSGVVARCVLTCTKHLWAWNLHTLEMIGETEKPLETYEVKVEDGDVCAYVDKELVYEFEGADDNDDDFFK